MEKEDKNEIGATNLGPIQTHVPVSWFVPQASEPPGHLNPFLHTVPLDIKTLLSLAEPNRVYIH